MKSNRENAGKRDIWRDREEQMDGGKNERGGGEMNRCARERRGSNEENVRFAV